MSQPRTDRELMQQALEALGWTEEWRPQGLREDAITALREALAQPEQEPVAWEDVLGAIARGWTHDDNKHKTMDVQLAVAIAKEIQDMVIAPPQRKPLTDEDLRKLADKHLFYQPEGYEVSGVFALARAIEAAHGIKERNT